MDFVACMSEKRKCFSRECEGGGIILICVLKKWDEVAFTEFIMLG
jgi:hypothetical protein